MAHGEAETPRDLKLFFSVATRCLTMLTALLPDDVKLTILGTHPEMDMPIILTGDDLHEVERQLHKLNTGQAEKMLVYHPDCNSQMMH